MKNAEKKRCHKKMAITIAMVDFENLSNFLCLKSLGQGVFQSWNNKCCVKKKFTAIIIYYALKIKKIAQKTQIFFFQIKDGNLKTIIFLTI